MNFFLSFVRLSLLLMKEKNVSVVMFRVLNANLGFEACKKHDGEKRQKLRKTDARAYKSSTFVHAIIIV